MGLREMNAERTRELILDVAISLFVSQGYEETTLDQIAERAGVSISTLYRYFPTKDLLVLTPIALHGQMADELDDRPANEPMEVALRHAVFALTGAQRGHSERLLQVSQLLATSDVLRARLRDELVRERLGLQQAIARRLGRHESDVYCALTARMAVSVFELAGAEARTGASVLDDSTLTAAAIRVMDSAAAEPPTLPSSASDVSLEDLGTSTDAT